MRRPILIVVERNATLADLTRRLVEAQGLMVQLTAELGEACRLLAGSLDIVLLTSSVAAAAVRTALFAHARDRCRILVVAAANHSKESLFEIMEAGAFSFMCGPAPAKAIVKEVHRIRKLLKAA